MSNWRRFARRDCNGDRTDCPQSLEANPSKLINTSFATQSKNPVPVKVLGSVHVKNKGKK